jgi:hypothetical protein
MFTFDLLQRLRLTKVYASSILALVWSMDRSALTAKTSNFNPIVHSFTHSFTHHSSNSIHR